MAQMVLKFRKIHPGFSRSLRNIAVIEVPLDGHVYHMVGPSVPGYIKGKVDPGPVPLDIWIDGIFFESEEVQLVEMATGADPVLLPTRGQSDSFKPRKKHSEQILAKTMDSRSHRDLVKGMLSERMFCMTRGHVCRRQVPEYFRQLEYWAYNVRSTEELDARLREWRNAGMPVDEELPRRTYAPVKVLTEPGAAPAGGPMAEELSGTGNRDNGGIDFSTLELRYLADPGDGRPVQYSFSARQGPAASREEGRRVAQLQSDAFFVWLNLPRQAFWVNLNPTEPDRVIDDRLGQTDAGRVLLEADLRMKKTIGQLIHPDTVLGKRFWNRVLADDGRSCTSFRTWIVPAPATVHEDGDSVHILDAPLAVKTEAQRQDTGGNKTACTGQTQAARQHEEVAYREVVLPKLRQVINTAPEYADIRRVYLARVAAEWYRERSEHTQTQFGHMINSRSVADWTSRQPWSARTVFDRYVDSYSRKEFNVNREIDRGNTRVITKFIYGGVDLSRIPMKNIGGTEFDRKWPGRARLVDQSVNEAAADQTGLVWLGSKAAPSVPAAAPHSVSATGTHTWLAVLGLYGLVAVLVGGGVLANTFVVRRRMARRPYGTDGHAS
jgi:hypothetical protein